MASIKANILLNGINTATSLLFPVVTFPYAARILLPDGIGTINFLNGIIGCIVLFAGLGIPLYAVKEIARSRDLKVERDRIAVEILLLSALLCTVGYLMVWCLGESVPKIHEYSTLFYILSLSILFTAIGADWFYQGIEDFKFMTIRAIIVRILSVAALFVFVRSKADTAYYAMVTVSGTVGNSIINFINLRRHLSLRFIRWGDLDMVRHLRPIFAVFLLYAAMSIYIYLNSTMLGFMSGDEAVGYFTAGVRIPQIGITIISSIATVFLPRCANLVGKGDDVQFADVVGRSIQATLFISIPMVVGMCVLSAPLIAVFCGQAYEASVSVLVIYAPSVVLIGINSILGSQILYPKGHMSIMIWSMMVGLVVNAVLNAVLIPYYGACGSALSTLSAEVIMLIILFTAGSRYFPFRISEVKWFAYLVPAALMGLVVYALSYLGLSDVWHIVSGVIAGVMTYMIILVVRRDQMASMFMDLLHHKS